jgi:hypothetical protein
VLYNRITGSAPWSSNTPGGLNGNWFVLQVDGNMVIYQNSTNRVVWNSGTNKGTNLNLNNNGNLMLYNGSSIVWQTNTIGR